VDHRSPVIQDPGPAGIAFHLGNFALELADGDAEDPCGLFPVSPGMAQDEGDMGVVVFLQGG
jgi:hypothetical protein